VAPAIPLVIVPNQPVSFSTDIINFELVPQQCVSRRLLILTNILPASTVDVSIDVMESFLLKEGLLSVVPPSARLVPGEHVVFEFRFFGNSFPIIFNDRVKIWVRELVKDTGGRKTAGANARLLEKIRTKKPPMEHSSVIIHSTSSITQQNLCRPNVPLGKTASLPSTITPHGLVEPSKISNGSVVVGPPPGTGNAGVSETIQINAHSAPNSPSRAASPGLVNALTKPGQGQSLATMTTVYEEGETDGGANYIEGSATNVHSRPGTSTSTKHSGGTSTTRNHGDRPLLFGPAKGFIVRVKGEVFRIDTVNGIFATGPLLGLINDYTNPVKLKFFPASTVLVPTPKTRAQALLEEAMMNANQDNANSSIDGDGGSVESMRSGSPTFEQLAQQLGQASLKPPALSPGPSKSGKSRNVTMIPSNGSTASLLVAHASAKERSASPTK
jgi:hypothetical protein